MLRGNGLVIQREITVRFAPQDDFGLGVMQRLSISASARLVKVRGGGWRAASSSPCCFKIAQQGIDRQPQESHTSRTARRMRKTNKMMALTMGLYPYNTSGAGGSTGSSWV